MKDKPSESEVASAVMAYLVDAGWDCYPEVQGSDGMHRADLVAIKGPVLWIIEVKLGASLSLLAQAEAWRGNANRISIATWRPTTYFVQRICRSFRIGVIRAWRDSWHEWMVREDLSAPLSRRAITQGLRDSLHPDMQRYAPGGTTLSGYSSAWKRTMDAAIIAIRANPGAGLRHIVEQIPHHYNGRSSAIASLRHWLNRDARVIVQREGRRDTYWPADEQP